MAKTNIHTASHDELVDAGLRAEIAEEILKLRRKGEIPGPEALEELPGVGPATVEQLRKALDFRVPERANGDERRGREAKVAEEPMRATANAGASAARASLRVARESGVAAREGQAELAERSTQGMVELNRLFLELMREQTQQTLEAWNALAGAVRWGELAKAVDWREVAEIQSRLVQQNMDRGAQVTRRYFELGQAIVQSVVAEHRSDRAA